MERWRCLLNLQGKGPADHYGVIDVSGKCRVFFREESSENQTRL